MTLTFAACDVPQSVTVYGIPDVDYYYSVLTLDHHLTQRNGEAQNPPVVGPKLTLWASDIMFFRVGASSPWDPERLHPERRFNRVRHYLKDQLYTDARYPASEASSDSVPWTQFCLKIYDRGHPTARINTALPLASVTLFPRVTGRFYQGKATEYGYRTYSGTAVVIPPLEFQMYSEVVSDGELCQPAPTSGGSGEWGTFFDGSEHEKNYRIGEVSIPREHFNKWINVRMRGVFGGERDGDGQVTVADPLRMDYQFAFGLNEYHVQTAGWLMVYMVKMSR